MGSEITLKNNEIKDIMKSIKSLEKREHLLQETTRNIIIQKGEFISFLGLLMKYVLTSAARNVLLSLGVKAATSATNAAIQKKIYESGMTALTNINENS